MHFKMSLFKTASKRIPSLTDMVGDMAVKKARKVTVPIDIQEAKGFEIYQKSQHAWLLSDKQLPQHFMLLNLKKNTSKTSL